MTDTMIDGSAATAANLRRAAVRGGTVLLSTRLLMQLFSWAVTIIVARFLRPDDYAVMAAGSIFVGLSDMLGEAGVGQALVQRKELQAEDTAGAFSLSLGLSTCLCVAVQVIAGPAGRFFHQPDVTAFLRVAGLFLLVTPFRTVPLALLERQLRLGTQSAVVAASILVQGFLTVALAASGWGFWSLLAGSAIGRLLEVVLLARRAAWRPRLHWLPTAASGLIHFGLHVSGANFLWYVYSNADYVVLGRLMGPVELGYYSLAYMLMSLPVAKITANLNQVAYPVFCRLQHDRPQLRAAYLRMTGVLGLVATPVMVGLALVADDAIVTVLGAKWTAAVLPFRALSLVGLLMVFGASLTPLINALGRPEILFRYALASVLVFPLAFILLGSRFGTIGVCAAWLVLYPVLLSILIVVARPVTGVGLTDMIRNQLPFLGSALLMALTVLLARQAAGDSLPGPVRLVLAIAVGSGAYAGSVWILARDRVVRELGMVIRELRSKRSTTLACED